MQNNIALVLTVLVLTFAAVPYSSQAASNIDLAGTWKFQVDPTDVGLKQDWQSPGYDASAWRIIKVPGSWESQGVTQANPHYKRNDRPQPYDGFAWYRRSVNIPVEWKGKTIYLNLGRVDDNDQTYVNGRLIGQTACVSPPASSVSRLYAIPPNIIKFGQSNVIAVRVEDCQGEGGIVQGPVTITIDRLAKQTPPSPHNEEPQDVVRFGGDVIIEPGQTVDDVVSLAGNIIVKGHVKGDAVTIRGNIEVASGGKVDGYAVALLGKIRVSEGAYVGGEIVNVYWPMLPSAFWILLLVHLFRVLIYVITALVITILFPVRTEVVAQTALARPGMSILLGLALWLLVLPTLLLLVITCVGIALIPVQIILVIAVAIFGRVSISLALGKKIGEATRWPMMSTLGAVTLGAVLIGLIRPIPLLGFIIVLVLTTMGMGAVVITGFGTDSEWWWKRWRPTTSA